MAVSLSTLAPSAIVVAAVGYCCLPYLDQPSVSPAFSKDVGKSHDIPQELLSPRVGSTQARDPFDLREKTGKDVKVGRAVAKKVGPATAVSDKKTQPPDTPLVSAALEAALARQAAQELQDALKGLVLNGTYVSSKRRFAVINSQLYAEGQSIRRTGDPKAKPLVVSKIDQHKVHFQFGVQTAELGYPGLPTKLDKKKSAPADRQAGAPIRQSL